MNTLQQAFTFVLNSLVFILMGVVAVFVYLKARAERLQASRPSKTVGITKKSLDSAFAPTQTKTQFTPVEKKNLKASPTSLLKPVDTQPPKQASIPITIKTNEQVELFELMDAKTNPDSQIRKSVAVSLGKLVAEQRAKPHLQQTIAVLGQLSQDPDPSVRQAATIALGESKSAKALPFLKRALRDFDSDVVKSASAAIAQFKSYPIIPKEKLPAKKRATLSATSG
ncbi:HEAT repeat domain-containing protein [Candidatus Gracilibacteria bacterium]|nr:HEAT repeat domain-containing protein [Candidatus Gracilibacteria bacterium]